MKHDDVPFPGHVVLERDQHEEDEDAHSDEARELARPKADRLLPHPLQQEEEEVGEYREEEDMGVEEYDEIGGQY